MRRRLRVGATDARGRPTSAGGLARWLERAAPAGARGTVCVALVPDRTMRTLNRGYRGRDRATDVLAFPADDKPQASLGPWALGRGPALGDIAIATGIARRQAREQGHGLLVELRILALHGLLHLLGYDHHTDQGRMRRVEERIRRRMGLPAGLIARTPRRARP